MRTGDFAAAHAISDEVLRSRDPAAHDDCNLPYHLRWVWDGRPFDGKDVLVAAIMGWATRSSLPASCRLSRAAPPRCTWKREPALVPLLRMLPGPGKLIPFQPASPAAPRACDLEIMELLHALRVMPSTIPPPPVLRVPPLRMAARAIGLCWSAGDWDPARSVPLAQLLAACELAEVELVSLQRGPAADAALRYRFINAHDRDTDMLRTARLIAGSTWSSRSTRWWRTWPERSELRFGCSFGGMPTGVGCRSVRTRPGIPRCVCTDKRRRDIGTHRSNGSRPISDAWGQVHAHDPHVLLVDDDLGARSRGDLDAREEIECYPEEMRQHRLDYVAMTDRDHLTDREPAA